MTNPKIYVGTYRKYNDGSLEGGWLSLRDYATYDELVSAMKRLHKDEKDPELMIQDCEDMPDGLDVMESISREEFDDIKQALKEEDEAEAGDATPEETPAYNIIDYSEKALAVTGDTRRIAAELKKLGGRFNPRLSCGPGWIFSKKKESELRELLAGNVTESKAVGEPKAKNGAWEQAVKVMAEYIDTLPERDKSYYKGHYQAAMKVQEGYILFEKPSIETKFCFRDEGPQYDLYKSLMAKEERLRDYFIRKNIQQVKLPKDQETMFVKSIDYKNIADAAFTEYPRDSWNFPFRGYAGDEPREATPEERSTYMAIQKEVQAQFRKRLDSYLKRYGVKKLHTWTYWADA